jgi:predicted nucleic acid-binding protein
VTLVVDAGVAAKWVLEEDGSDRAAALRVAGDDFIAPSLIVAEIGNAIWKRAVWKEVSTRDAVQAMQSATAMFARLVPPAELAARAMQIAIELRHPICDCFYLALAERDACALITADRRLMAAASAVKDIELRAL